MGEETPQAQREPGLCIAPGTMQAAMHVAPAALRAGGAAEGPASGPSRERGGLSARCLVLCSGSSRPTSLRLLSQWSQC